MVKHYNEGGCRMVDIFAYAKAIKVATYRRLIKGECVWEALFSTICNCDTEKLVKLGDDYPLMCAKRTSNIFWKESLTILHEFMQITEKNNVNHMKKYLLYNSELQIDNKSIYLKELHEKNITFVYDLFDLHGNILTFDDFREKFNVNICFTTYFGIKRAIFKAWPSLKDGSEIEQLPIMPHYLQCLLHDDKGTHSIYDAIIKEHKVSETYQVKWEQELNISHDQWKKINQNIFSGTESKYLQWFQYRITHRILATNKLLYAMNIKDNALCSFCNAENETILHLLYECPRVQELILQLRRWLQQNYSIIIDVDKKSFILGKCDNYALNVIFLLVKKYIYETRIKAIRLHFDSLKSRILDHIQLLKFIHRKNGTMDRFYLKWDKFNSLFNS